YENKKVGNDFDNLLDVGHCDLALINGNHYLGRKQILFLDPAKADSIRRNIDKITDPVALVEFENEAPVFAEVVEKFGDRLNQLPRFSYDEPARLAEWLNEEVRRSIP